MKYRIRPSQKQYTPYPHRSYRLKGKTTLRPIKAKDFYKLFDPEPFAVPQEVKGRKPSPWDRLRAYTESVRKRLAQLTDWLERRKTREMGHRTLPMLAGALCGAWTVAILSAALVLATLTAPYLRSYTTVTIPDFEGKDPHSVLEGDTPFNLILHYESNPQVAEGLVISQSPPAGVSRRIYSDTEYYNIVLTVSQPAEPYTLEELTGLSRRDAALTLRNRGMWVTVQEEYSSGEAGTVIGTLPASGTPLSKGDTVTLLVSLGQKARRAYVPDLSGLGESEAIGRLTHAGLRVGSVSYRTSPLPTGTVIDQQYAPYTMIEANTEVSLSVSLGERYAVRSVPDLYGMSTEDAALALREYGLAVGERYSVGNAAPKGTVITQSPLPGTPITSATYAVDLYVSS